jgi:hypothetical protein
VNDAATKYMVNTIMPLFASCSAHSHYFFYLVTLMVLDGVEFVILLQYAAFSILSLLSHVHPEVFLSPSIQLMIKCDALYLHVLYM